MKNIIICIDNKRIEETHAEVVKRSLLDITQIAKAMFETYRKLKVAPFKVIDFREFYHEFQNYNLDDDIRVSIASMFIRMNALVFKIKDVTIYVSFSQFDCSDKDKIKLNEILELAFSVYQVEDVIKLFLLEGYENKLWYEHLLEGNYDLIHSELCAVYEGQKGISSRLI